MLVSIIFNQLNQILYPYLLIQVFRDEFLFYFFHIFRDLSLSIVFVVFLSYSTQYLLFHALQNVLTIHLSINHSQLEQMIQLSMLLLLLHNLCQSIIM